MTESPDTATVSSTRALRQELMNVAASVAREAAELIVDRRSLPPTVKTKSSISDLVTDVDTASEALIVARLGQLRPDDAVMGEEGASVAGTSPFRWIIDPIDGTTSFVYGYPGFTVSIAVAEGSQIVAGAVADPTTARSPGRDIESDLIDVYVGGLGLGSRCNDRPLAVSGATELANVLAATGFSFDPERRARQAMVLATVLQSIRDIRRSGSAALDLIHVATGQVDAYFEVGLNEWDRAAAALIAAEAGATVRCDDTSPLTFAATPGIADELYALLESAGGMDV